MKSFLLVVTTFFGLLSAFGQQSSFIGYSVNPDNAVSVVEFNLGEYRLQTIDFNGAEYSIPQAPKAARMLQKGAPDLIQFSRSLLLPDNGNVRVEIVDVQFEEIPNVRIAPSYGNLMRSENPAQVDRVKGIHYTQNAFFPSEIAATGTPYIFRNTRGCAIHIHPLQYNPVTQVLRVNHTIRLRVVTDSNTPGLNERNTERASKAVQGDQELYLRHFLNFNNSRYDAPESQGKMLIIAHDAFASAMQPFVAWKMQCGIPTELVNYSELGSIAEITNRIRDEYYSNNLRYAVLVGDIDQIPSPVRSGGKSDPSYGYVDGEDAYAEVQIGRFSAESIEDVQTQVQRILAYEQASEGSHFSRVIGIGSQEGPGDDNEMDFEHIRGMHADLMGYSYSNAAEFFEGSQGGNDASGDPSAEQLAESLYEGAGLVLYTGHGSSQSFGTTGFSNADIANLSNTGKLPLIWSVACVNGEFDNGNCFAETWMRHAVNGQPAGATSVLMSSINQSWDPPMCAQDEMVDVLAELNATNGIRTYGGISLSGCMQMNDEYGTAGDEMTDTWHIFGDPSLLVRTQTPLAMTVSHDSSVPLGISQLNVMVDVEDARVALLQNGSLLSSGVVSGGMCTLEFDALSTPMPLQVSVTAFNRIPYQGVINVIVPDGAFLIYESNVVNDENGNNNQLADYNENFFLNISTLNVGNADPGPVTGILSVESAFVTLNGPTGCVFYPSANPEIYASEDCFSVQVADGVADGTVVQFNLQLTSESGNSWTVIIPLTLHAPEIEVNDFELVELSGNGNGRADAGEQIRILIPNRNVGSATSVSGSATLSHSTPALQTLAEELTPDGMDAGSEFIAAYDYQIPADFAVPASVPFVYSVMFGMYDADFTFNLPVGELVEDFENGFPSVLWSNSGDFPWVEDQSVVFEGATSMKSGTINNLEQSDLFLSGNVTEPAEIKFNCKVSSEEGFDFLRFYVDGVEMASWSGLVDWTEVSFPVSAGQHEFQWSYVKDDIVAANDDAAWIDFVHLPNMDGSQGIESHSSNAVLRIYPNPVNNFVTLSGCKDGEYRIDLINQLGQIVATYSGKAAENRVTIMLDTQLPAGVYFLKIAQSTNETQTLRLLKF
jgi:hypothetical protein